MFRMCSRFAVSFQLLPPLGSLCQRALPFLTLHSSLVIINMAHTKTPKTPGKVYQAKLTLSKLDQKAKLPRSARASASDFQLGDTHIDLQASVLKDMLSTIPVAGTPAPRSFVAAPMDLASEKPSWAW
jgi:hypothetical protein